MISTCSQCGLRGYELTDEENQLCHNCVRINAHKAQQAAEYQAMLDNFLETDWNDKWQGGEWGKALIGNIFCDLIKENGGIPHFKEMRHDNK